MRKRRGRTTYLSLSLELLSLSLHREDDDVMSDPLRCHSKTRRLRGSTTSRTHSFLCSVVGFAQDNFVAAVGFTSFGREQRRAKQGRSLFKSAKLAQEPGIRTVSHVCSRRNVRKAEQEYFTKAGVYEYEFRRVSVWYVKYAVTAERCHSRIGK